MKKALLISLAIVIGLLGYCSYPFVSVSAITLSLVDQAGEPLRGEAEAVFLDAAGKEIVTISDATPGSWEGHLHWWAHSGHRQSLASPAKARRAVAAIVSAPGCAPAKLPIALTRTYEPLSFAPHGGGPAYLLYEFEREVTLSCAPDRAMPPAVPGPDEGG